MRPSKSFDWFAYLLPLGMLIAPLAYYHDKNVHLSALKVPGTDVLVGDCEKAARDRSLVINVDYSKNPTAKADPIDPKICTD